MSKILLAIFLALALLLFSTSTTTEAVSVGKLPPASNAVRDINQADITVTATGTYIVVPRGGVAIGSPMIY